MNFFGVRDYEMRICAKLMVSSLLTYTGLFVGCGPKVARISDPTSLSPYIADAKKQVAPTSTAEGSLWVNNARRSDLFADFKAREINDVVTITVNESVQALASADSTSNKATDASANFTNLFGLENKIKELPNALSTKSASDFKGQGSTSRTTTLQASMTARVIDVLPNGNLVVEGAREIRVNHENQTLYITGVVRPVDISRNNVVPSSAVAQMAVRVQGRGVVSQPLKPGWLSKILTGVLPF